MVMGRAKPPLSRVRIGIRLGKSFSLPSIATASSDSRSSRINTRDPDDKLMDEGDSPTSTTKACPPVGRVVLAQKARETRYTPAPACTRPQWQEYLRPPNTATTSLTLPPIGTSCKIVCRCARIQSSALVRSQFQRLRRRNRFSCGARRAKRPSSRNKAVLNLAMRNALQALTAGLDGR
jgi:hypothetical protein